MSKLDQIVSHLLETDVSIVSSSQASGGCIHDSRSLQLSDGRKVFLKTNSADAAPLFRAEAEGLKALAKAGEIRVPAILAQGVFGHQAYLLLEFLELRPLRQAEVLGTQLAALHRHTAERFGFPENNFIGKTPQANEETENWIEFLRQSRFRPQFRQAREQGYTFRDEDRLLENLDAFFVDYQPLPSLLHGDLWGGNAGSLPDGTPVIFDPAVHYGDRESDLAMTELFGGFGPAFYEAYEAAWPMHEGYREVRRELYQLYHLLNHLNLFGGSYGTSAERSLRRLLSLAGV